MLLYRLKVWNSMQREIFLSIKQNSRHSGRVQGAIPYFGLKIATLSLKQAFSLSKFWRRRSRLNVSRHKVSNNLGQKFKEDVSMWVIMLIWQTLQQLKTLFEQKLFWPFWWAFILMQKKPTSISKIFIRLQGSYTCLESIQFHLKCV